MNNVLGNFVIVDCSRYWNNSLIVEQGWFLDIFEDLMKFQNLKILKDEEDTKHLKK